MKLCGFSKEEECRASDIRGSFIVDNKEFLRKKMRRGENIKWIINYLFLNPCITSADCRKDLLLWRGYDVCDRSRGHYASYFYDRWSYKWYFQKYWLFIEKEGEPKRMQLTSLGLTLIDEELQSRLKQWEKVPRVQCIYNSASEGKNYFQVISEINKDFIEKS